MSRFYSIFAFVLISCAGVWWGLSRKPEASASGAAVVDLSKVVEVQAAQRESIAHRVRLTGTLRSRQQTVLKAQKKGTLEVFVDPGQRVTTQTLIARILDPTLELNYKILEEAQSLTQEQLERAKRLHASGSLSKQAMEDKALAFFEAQKRLSEAQQTLEAHRIYAPFDGIVGIFKQRSGAIVGENDVLAVFYNPEQLIVEVDIPLPVARKVDAATQVLFEGNAYPLTHLQTFLDDNTRMCPAIIAVEAPGACIGATVQVELVLEQRTDVVVIPFEAVFFKEGNAFVYTVEDLKAVPTPIELGIRDQNRVEVTQGLEPGTVFVKTAPERLYPYSAVRIAGEQL